MNDENKHPRPRITGEDEFMAAKSAGQNGGVHESSKEKDISLENIPLSAENIRALGYVLACYHNAIKMNPDPDGPPLALVIETKDKIDAILSVFPPHKNTGD